MIRIGSIPTSAQKSSSLPSTTESPTARGSSSDSAVTSSSSSSLSVELPVELSSEVSSSTSSAASSVSASSSPVASSSGSSASSSAALVDSAASTSGVVTIFSIPLSTSSQLRPMISEIEFQRFRPAFPVKWSMPPDTVPRLGLPLKNFDTAASSHTDPIDDTIASATASAATASSDGY